MAGNGTVVVKGNYIEGPGAVGLQICCNEGVPVAYDNVVRGFDVGIRASDGGTVSGNTVTNCSGNGIEGTRPTSGLMRVWSNVVRSCGGHGIRVYGSTTSADVYGNTVDSVGACGIRLESFTGFARANTVRVTGSHGIQADGAGAVSANTVLRATGDGIRAPGASADSNVVGRCGGAGIRTAGGSLRQNTAYLNFGAGFVLDGGTGNVVNRNIAFGNAGPGLDASAATTPVLGCDDWFSNIGGATLGVAPGFTDLAVDPKFCSLAIDDARLAATSPLLAAPGCGLIGARGLGCATPTTAVETTAPLRRAFEARPSPSRGNVRLSWNAGPGAASLEIFDVNGARRFRVDLPAGAGEFRWNAADDAGLPLPSGVYFARLWRAEGEETTRIVLQR